MDGCLTKTCTLIGCGPQLTIGIDGPGGRDLVQGPDPYEIVLDFDGAISRTECSYETGAIACEQLEEAAGFSVSPMTEFGEVSLWVHQDGAERGPDRVGVQVIVAGEVLVDEELEPVYDGSEINGEGCGFCYEAQESVEVPDPTQ